MDNLVKDIFYKLGVYDYAKKYLKKPYTKLFGIAFNISSKAAIKALIKCLNQNNYKYWLEFGTLLGAVREKGFISHDYDIDIAMYINDRDEIMEQKLSSSGFKLKKRAKLLSGEIIEETYKYKTAYIDIFYAYKIDSEIIIFDYQTINNLSPNECFKKFGGLRVYENVLSEFNLMEYEFFESQVLVPNNWTIHLQEIYGKDFMMKNKNWSVTSSPARKETSKFAVVEHFT